MQSIDDADASWSQDQWVTYYRKERSQFWCFLGFVRSKLIFHLHESKCLPTFTFYNPLLIKMCSVQSIDDADASWSQETRGDILLQRKVPIWTFLRSPPFKTSFNLQESRFLQNFTLYNPLLMKMCNVQSIDDADASWSQEQWVTYYLNKSVIQLYW